MEWYQILDLTIKFVAFVGAAWAVRLNYQTMVHNKKKVRYEFIKDIYEDFRSPAIVEKRNKVASFWQKQLRKNVASTCKNVTKLALIPDDEARIFIKDELGIEFDNIDDKFLKCHEAEIIETNYTLNMFEHLAKLVEYGIIEKEDVKGMFYTMFADTYVVCMPYIIYRRQSKPLYAHKMKGLLLYLPMISDDFTKV